MYFLPRVIKPKMFKRKGGHELTGWSRFAYADKPSLVVVARTFPSLDMKIMHVS
ncbi:hypothetical protein HanPSC8_Chr06g0242831 [Helianthus annuus]|nr:hypothetical protein HanPSC8_Chr06g0242831 [Helianthus annuus]